MKIKETFINVQRDEKFNNEEAIREYQRTGNKELRNKIVEQNLPLIIEKAAKYYHPIQLELDDLIDSTVIILIKAIDYFNPEGGNKFSTYAGRAIHNALSNCVSNWYGEGINGYGNPIRKYRMVAVSIFGNKADIYNEDVVDYVLSIMVEDNLLDGASLKEIRSRLLSKKIEDLDEEELDIIENIECEVNEEQDNGYFISKHKEDLFKLLTETERKIIEYECGFVDGIPHKQIEVAKILGVSRQSVNQHEKKAIEKMKRKAEVYN